jgi:hypothetical protein
MNQVQCSVKELLHEVVDLLSEDEAKQLLELIREFQQRNGISLTLRRPAKDPMFKVPANPFEPFDRVEPAPIEGQPASELLIEDRR